MDERQRRIHEDLHGEFRGELRFDPLARSLYASDASLYQIPPLGIAFPKDHDDVVTLAKYAGEHDLPLVPRGAGTGLAGNSLGSGLVVDFSRHMRKIEIIDDATVRVQPGVVRDNLNNLLRETGRYFPPDPSNSSVTTIGSMLALDAAGSHAVRIGSTRDHVKSIQVVLAGGETFSAVKEQRVPFDQTFVSAPQLHVADEDDSSLISQQPSDQETSESCRRRIISQLTQILKENAELIQERQPRTVRNCCGYYLRGILSEDSLNLPRFLVGSEGTLGLFTSTVLHTAPISDHRGVVLLLFGRIEDAVAATQLIIPQQPSACDLLDRRLLSLAREADPRFREIILPNAEAALIVEHTDFNKALIQQRISRVIKSVRGSISRVVVAHQAFEVEDVEFLWSLPQKVVPLLTRIKGTARPQPFIEDIAVPPEALNDFLHRAQKVFQKHQVTTSLYAHAASGQLHLRPFFAPPDDITGQKMEGIARDLYQAVFLAGGTISGEHGDGLSRTSFVRAQYGPLYQVFQQIKDLFDPHNLLNPGKIINDDPHLSVRNFRPVLEPVGELVELQLNWTQQELAEATSRCNGCGVCKTNAESLRMCPFHRLEPMEETSPRSKANVMRHYLSGTLEENILSSESMKTLAGYCFNCKQCQLECPSNVNIPQMMIEAKANAVQANGLSGTDWLLSRAHSFGELGSTLSMATNWILGNSFARWVLEKTFGISRHRKLPRFARRSFLRTTPRKYFRRPDLKHTPKPVIFFVDHFANFHDPELAQAFLAILQHNNIPVHIPPTQSGSGMAMISAGDLDAARKIAEHNIRELVELAREGCTIVCTEPAAALCLQQEYPMLIDHPDAKLVADQVQEAGNFLEQLHLSGRLKTDFREINFDVGYHTPCHLKALDAGTPLRKLLTFIPGLRVHTIEKGCSGMAGAFGLTQENFKTSLQLGWGLISRMRAGDLHAGTTECSSCKIQMEQGTTTPTIHPLKILALAYGLMPEIEQRFQTSKRKLTVT